MGRRTRGLSQSLRSVRLLLACIMLAAWVGMNGCLGPKAIRSTRLRYNDVIHDTNDEQLLLNIVRLRYADSPIFIDLPSITSQFEVSGRSNYLGGYGNQIRAPANLGFGELDDARYAHFELSSP